MPVLVPITKKPNRISIRFANKTFPNPPPEQQHTQVRVSARIKRKPTRYEVSVVTRDEVGAYKPYLWEQSVFEKGPMFRYVQPDNHCFARAPTMTE